MPPLTVIIATFNRSDYLQKLLTSLTRQTIRGNAFEVVLIDDGSTDDTRSLVSSFSSQLNLSYYYQENSGAATARNQGIAKANGELLVFLDDDDFAAPDLLAQHLKTHRKYPEETYAVLNFTTWAPELKRTPLMDFIVGEGELLFSYGSLNHGDILDYRFFWMGRSSCKKSFLMKYGTFNPLFRIFEDVDLPFRLSKHGLKMVYNQKAVTYMIRSFQFEDFCRRCIQQGKAYYLCSLMHPETEIQQFCLLEGINQSIAKVKNDYERFLHQARELQSVAEDQIESGIPLDDHFRKALYQAYGQAFWACRIKGIMEERKALQPIDACRQPVYLLDAVEPDFKVVAIICAFNEGDIIHQVLEHLIANEIYVYLLDHHSTDNTVEEASRWLGKGLLGIETFPEAGHFPERYKEIFSLEMILQRVEQLHNLLGADWYLHYDADEFRDPPWPGMTLREAIQLVDTLGFNAINFEYLNFWPTEDTFLPGLKVHDFIEYYEPATDLDKPRINAWKNFGQEINLTTFVGHKVCFQGLKVFPLQFINRHYRIRSQAHGLRKVFQERISRFDPQEKATGSHIHYDGMDEQVNFIKNRNELTRYHPSQVRKKLWFKAAFNAGKY